MLTNYYTLRQLVREWNAWVPGTRIIESYSQRKGELSFVLEDKKGDAHTILTSVQAPLRFLYHDASSAKARKNTARKFSNLEGCTVRGISIDSSDRPISIEIADGRRLWIELFGPRANVYLIDEHRRVLESFRRGEIAPGEEVRIPKPEADPTELLAASDGRVGKRLLRAFPNLGRNYAEVVLQKVGLDPASELALTDYERAAVISSVGLLEEALEAPTPRIYWKGPNAVLLSLLPLDVPDEHREETFSTLDEAVRVYVRRKLKQVAFDQLYLPLEKSLTGKLSKAKQSLSRMQSELSKGNRADQHERFGHLLMALQHQVKPGSHSVTVEDIVAGKGMVTIPLKSSLSAVQNAERYYSRARESRQARLHLEKRIGALDTEINACQKAFDALTKVETVVQARSFIKNFADLGFAAQSNPLDTATAIPYRTYELEDGYEVWVGRNAAQNERLTTRDARKYDIWLHARGVAGSHVVLRIPRRNESPPAKIIERAASIAAFHSKARTSEFAPVIVAEKRYVRKPRRSPTGTVIVEREEVLIVKPELPVQ